MQKKSNIYSWGIGLSSRQALLLCEALGDGHRLVLTTVEELPSLLYASESHPSILWISSGLGQTLCQLPVSERQHIEQASKAILLDEGYTLADFENACDLGVTEIVRPPYTRNRIAEIMRHALEVQSIHHDLHCMSKEILLERELLERKNELLSFLVNFLGNSTDSLDVEHILQAAYAGLDRLLPLRSMHMALWDKEGTDHPSLSLYICVPECSKVYSLWRSALLNQVRHTVGAHFSLKTAQRLHLPSLPAEWAESTPEDGMLLYLPIMCGQEQLGILLLLSSINRHLGRDQAVALDSAMRHFAVSIKNALRFQRIQMHINYDGLHACGRTTHATIEKLQDDWGTAASR